MKNRTIILLLSVFLFGMAFGCKPLSDKAEDYLLAIQHTTSHDILIVDTKLIKSNGILDNCTVKLKIDGLDKVISNDDVECAIIDNLKRGWFALKLDSGSLPADNATLTIKINFHKGSNHYVSETPELDLAKAKEYQFKLDGIEYKGVIQDETIYSYDFSLSSTEQGELTFALGADVPTSIVTVDIPSVSSSCESTSNSNLCNFSIGPSMSVGPQTLFARIEKEGVIVTPLLYVVGCIQTPEVVDKDGAGLCLPAESAVSPDCEADPTAEGCPNSPDCLADPTAPGCENAVNPDDPDQDGIVGNADACPDQAEIYTFSSLRPADGVLDGCPNSNSSTDPNLGEGEGENTIDLPGMGNDGSGCSLNPATGTNAGGLLLILAAFAHMIVRRKR